MGFAPSQYAALLAVAVGFTATPLAAQRSLASLVTLPAPSGATVRNDPGALGFSWQPVAGAIGYRVEAASAPTGPWTSLVAAPIASTTFSYTPIAGALIYYRIAALPQLGEPGNPAVVPFIYNLPWAETPASATQSGADLTVSWVPVVGALGYLINAQGLAKTEQLQAFNTSTSATFRGLITSGPYDSVLVRVAPIFPRGVATVPFPKMSSARGPAADPNICWPPGEDKHGGVAPAALTATPSDGAVALSWGGVGQVTGYRVERAPAGSNVWESMACLRVNYFTPSYIDRSVTLQPAKAYDYRITSVGPTSIVGSSITTVLVSPPVGPTFVVGASYSVQTNGTTTKAFHVGGFPTQHHHLITTSYGFRAVAPWGSGVAVAAPLGTHLLTVARLYPGGLLGGATTVPVVVQ
ncbi:MAG: hypothetical protein ACKVZ0_21960 [Gemmatimonadales bacterium]